MAEKKERDPNIRLEKDLDISKVGPCGVEAAPGIGCTKPKGHDDQYYPYLDYGQSGWYADFVMDPTPSDRKHAYEWNTDEAG